MPAGGSPPAIWPMGLSALVVLASAVYQAAGYRRLRRRCRDLGELKARQRQVYRGLEMLQRRGEALRARVSPTVRPVPYETDDERALALKGELEERLEALRRHLRPLEVAACPPLRPMPVLLNQYWLRLGAVEKELAFGRRLRQDLAAAEAVADELEGVLARVAGKPREVQRSLADLQALAEALVEDIELEKGRGAGGLAPLAFESEAVRANAVEWAERLEAARAPEDAPVAIRAEARRRQLLSRLAGLYKRAESIAGVHDRALGRRQRLDAAMQRVQKHQSELRAPLAQALRPALQSLEGQRRQLEDRYRQHDAEAYEDVAQQAWGLMAQVRGLDQQLVRLAEADGRAVQAMEACRRGVEEMKGQVRQERTESVVELDLSEVALERLERYTAQMQELLAEVEGGLQPPDPAAALALLGQVEARAAICSQEEKQARQALASWQAQRRRAQEVLARLEASMADHERLTHAWQALQDYCRTNWPQVEADWYEGYGRERTAVLEACREVREALAGGELAQSAGEELRARCDALDQRWQKLLHAGQRVTNALGQAQAAERQVQEGITALRADAQAVARTEEGLPAEMPEAAELLQLCREIVVLYRRVQDEAQWPARADYRRLRDESIARLQELLAMYRLSYAQLVETQRAALKRQLGALWEQWEPLGQRLAKAAPVSDVDRQGLEQRWQALLAEGKSAAAGLEQVLALQSRADALAEDLARGQRDFEAEREAVRTAEQRLARTRRAAAQLRDCAAALLAYPHPGVVDDEWERSTKAWRKGEQLIRRLEPQRSLQPYLARLEDATAQYEEARGRARSALVRLVRYAFLEDPDGMHQACEPIGRRWGRLGVTAREEHIRELLAELEQAGQVGRLVERVSSYLLGKGSPAS